jgi:hypothetical protein
MSTVAEALPPEWVSAWRRATAGVAFRLPGGFAMTTLEDVGNTFAAARKEVWTILQESSGTSPEDLEMRNAARALAGIGIDALEALVSSQVRAAIALERIAQSLEDWDPDATG